MAGHSKWANIRHKKGREDAKRGKVFTKLIRELTVAARMGGSDVSGNPRLRAAIDSALSNNMPKDTIKRAVDRGAGDGEGGDLDEIRYEGYGPGGIAVLVDTMTDNRNRTVAEVRHAFSKSGGNLGTEGSVSFQFTKSGVVSFAVDSDEDAIMEAALDAGADDVISHDDGSIDVLTTPEDFGAVVDGLKDAGFESENAEVTMRPDNTQPLELKDAEKMLRLLDMLEELDDVQSVYSNADISEDILAQI